jgi:TetR/AcrR family transcriptional regulator, transcriptional repressor for nem operon
MSRAEQTKEKILEAGARIIHRKGFNHTGIQEILQVAGVPKGSFYFYFKNKEDFGLQVVDYFNRSFKEMLGETVADRSVSALGRMETILNGFIRLFGQMEYTCGCPVGNLAQEMGDLSPVFSEKLKDSIDAMAQIYANLLHEARQAGEIRADLDIAQTARFIVSSWHGALIHMKIVKGPEPLENHKKFIFQSVLRTSA